MTYNSLLTSEGKIVRIPCEYILLELSDCIFLLTDTANTKLRGIGKVI